YVIYREKKERIALGIYDQKVKRLNVKLGLILALQMLALAVYELELTMHYDIVSITATIGIVILVSSMEVPRKDAQEE
ncbi:MAG: hypothetical protein K6G23_09205, partial [Lachnospiraceae bacterium]|nr:hypothetical protein [Lachnospiraceae bacterium]